MVNERSTDVGCAISSFLSANWKNNYIIACNYASTNIRGCSAYRSGKPASLCTLGKDSEFPALCKISEPIDPNKIYCFTDLNFLNQD
jgi:hypothetical protein